MSIVEEAELKILKRQRERILEDVTDLLRNMKESQEFIDNGTKRLESMESKASEIDAEIAKLLSEQ